MNIEKIKDKTLLLKMKSAIENQMKRLKKENPDAVIDDLLIEELKIDIRLEELGK